MKNGNSGVKTQSQTPDYPTLRKQIDDYTSTFYGPHRCEGCGRHDIVRKSFLQGAESWEEREITGGTEYIPHHCSHVLLFKHLAGGVLTVIDAVFPPSSPQLKAIKDLLKQAFSKTIAEARQLEGDNSCESMESMEQVATA